ncbi:tetratricopeptide repeat protein [Rhodohalobacter halophilus]|uniref:tetratricopeptide repeat protein n=1 Tax=Rhodohalobacter halophilus TaxID=1812810 RepID=UPI00083FD224|nr:tetratricopeptide repeat protein [Rhodohalobacter halophilus]
MSRTLRYYCLTVLILSFPATLLAQQNQESYQPSLKEAIHLFDKGLYDSSIPLLEQAMLEAESEITKEMASFLHARAFIKVDSLGVNTHVDRFVQMYPGSNKSSVLLKELANLHKEQGDLEAAISRMDEALNYPQSNRERAELYYMLGETSAEYGDFEQARQYFLTLSDEHRRSEWSPKALYARGRLFLEEERFSESADAFELLRERHPLDPMTRRIGTALGESYYQQGNFEDAIGAFQDALPNLDHEGRQKAVYLTAESYNALNRYEDATRFYRQYINGANEDDDLRIAHYGLGWVYHKQEIYHWAARSFGEAAQGDDELARKALYYKGANEKMAGRSDQAIETFREFGDRYDYGVFSEQAYFEWAVLAFEVGFYGEAIEALRPLAQRADELENPGDVITFLGEVYFANGEYTRALETFEIADELADLDPAVKRQARFQRAWVQYSNQAFAQSQPDFERVHDESPDSPLGREALFWSADAHYQIRNFGPAAQQYARFIERYPNHELVGAAKYALGWSYFMMGDFENATDPLIDFLENYEPPSMALFPYDTDTQLRIGDAYYAQGEYREALRYYNMAIGAEPGGDYAMFQVANSHYRMNQNFEAVSQFRRVLRIYPYSTLREQAQYNIAYIYLNTGNYDQAIEEFRTVINRYPGTEWAARAQYNIGDSYYNAGQYDQAISAYRQVLEDYPRSSYIIEAINGIQFAQLSAGEEDTSTDVLEDFLADNPTSSTADRLRFRQAENMMQSGDYEAAVDEFRQYLRITNNTELVPEAYMNMADAYERVNNRVAAIEALETLVNDYPNSDQTAGALSELGRLHYEEGNYQQSLNRFEQLIETDSRYRQEGILGMGDANLALGNVNRARQYYEEVLSINENSDPARIGMGKVLLEDGRVDEARRFFSLVAENNTTDTGAEAQYLLGQTFLEAGDSEAAREAFSRVQVLFETYDIWVAEAQYKIAEIHIREGRRGDAISLLESIVDRYPGTSGAEKAQNLLNRN